MDQFTREAAILYEHVKKSKHVCEGRACIPRHGAWGLDITKATRSDNVLGIDIRKDKDAVNGYKYVIFISRHIFSKSRDIPSVSPTICQSLSEVDNVIKKFMSNQSV